MSVPRRPKKRTGPEAASIIKVVEDWSQTENADAHIDFEEGEAEPWPDGPDDGAPMRRYEVFSQGPGEVLLVDSERLDAAGSTVRDLFLGGSRSRRGGKLRGKQQTAERAERDAETFPEGPPTDEPLTKTCKLSGERDRVTEDRARRRASPLPPRPCAVCGETFQPKRRTARECLSCRKLTKVQKARRKAHRLGG